VKMPKMGGLELVHHFRRWFPSARALIISGDPDVVSTKQPPSNYIALLPKPFTSAELVKAMSELLDG